MEPHKSRVLSADQTDLLRQIPSVDELLTQPRLASLAKRVDRTLLLEVTRATLADLRAKIAGGQQTVVLSLDPASLEDHITSAVEQILSRSLQPVINATGVILHTNLGRSPLTESAIEEFRRTAT